VNERINEEIGALLDGRLESGPRTELLARLAASDDDFDVFADTAAVLREAEEGELVETGPIVPRAGEVERPAEVFADTATVSREAEMAETEPVIPRVGEVERPAEVFADAATVPPETEEGETAQNEFVAGRVGETERPAEVIPLRPRRASGWRSPPVRWLAAAALLAGVALVPLLRSRSSADAWRDLGRVGALASPSDAALPDDWRNSWRVTRGGGNVVGEDNGVISRIGARQVDLEVAARSGNYDQTAQIAREIVALLDNVDGGGTLAGGYREVAGAADHRDPNLRSSVASAREALNTFFDEGAGGDYLALGGWTEAARLAAHRQDAEFFRRRESRDALQAAANLGSLDDEAKTAVARLQAAVDQRQVANWNAVREDLNTLQDKLAR
jgi:hypothetical protein